MRQLDWNLSKFWPYGLDLRKYPLLCVPITILANLMNICQRLPENPNSWAPLAVSSNEFVNVGSCAKKSRNRWKKYSFKIRMVKKRLDKKIK